MKISVIVCAYNSSLFIKRTLLSLCQQSLSPSEYEIIVVDNNSTDNTADIIKQFVNEHPENDIRYLFEPSQGLSHARNKGITEARSALVVFIDDDAEGNQEFLEQHIAVFDQFPEVIAVGGKVEAVYPENSEPKWMSKYIRGIYSVCDYGDEIKPFPYKYPTGCNMAFRKNVIQSINGFNPDIKYRSDEKYVFDKLKVRKNQIYYTPKAVAYHHVPEERVEHDAIRKISYIIGAGERERFQGRIDKLFFKFLEYMVKLGAAGILALKFIILGHLLKAKYLWLIRYYVIVGFFTYRN